MQPEMTPIIPVDQVVIHFAGHEFLIVRLPDGRIAVVLRHLCEALELDRWAQTRRIQSQSALAKHLLLVRIKTPGGPQEVHALVTSVLSLWLGGFRLGRLSEEKRALIELLQADAADAFQSHFYQLDAQAHPQQQAKVSQSPQPPLPTPDVSPVSVFDMLRAVINRVEQDHREMEAWKAQVGRQRNEEAAWKAEMQHQMGLQREATEVLWSVVLGNASAPEEALNSEQQQAIQLLLHHQHKVTGQPRAALEHELLMLVGVAEFRHLQQQDWKPIMAWFRQRLGW